jgi:hypothetical protein
VRRLVQEPVRQVPVLRPEPARLLGAMGRPGWAITCTSFYRRGLDGDLEVLLLDLHFAHAALGDELDQVLDLG